MKYEKPVAEVIYFTNRDVITTSGGQIGDGCKNRGQNAGNGCNGNSGNCPGQSWKNDPFF